MTVIPNPRTLVIDDNTIDVIRGGSFTEKLFKEFDVIKNSQPASALEERKRQV